MSAFHASPHGRLRRDQARSAALRLRGYERQHGAPAGLLLRPVSRCCPLSTAPLRPVVAPVPDACDSCPSLGQRGDALVTLSSMSSACVCACAKAPGRGPCGKLRHRAEGQGARQQVSVSEPRYRTIATSLQGGPCASSVIAVAVAAVAALGGAGPGLAGRGWRRKAGGSRGGSGEHARSGARWGRPVLKAIGTVALRCDQIGGAS
jgi:hypothetical protein